jgi:hypothetical protein
MKINTKALAITSALIWGGCVLVVAVLHRIWPSYGVEFLNLIASIYPGYHVGGLREAMVGTLYALLDGAVGGAVVAWVYNGVLGRQEAA